MVMGMEILVVDGNYILFGGNERTTKFRHSITTFTLMANIIRITTFIQSTFSAIIMSLRQYPPLIQL